MKFSIDRVVKATKRSRSSIHRLIKNGKLKAEKSGRVYFVEAPGGMSELQMIVAKEVPYTRKAKKSNGTVNLFDFLSLGKDKIKLLIKLGEKYSPEELEILLTLKD